MMCCEQRAKKVFVSSEDEEVAQPLFMELLRVGTLMCTGREGDSALSLCLFILAACTLGMLCRSFFGGARLFAGKCPPLFFWLTEPQKEEDAISYLQ